MKMILTLSLLSLVACRTAFISAYSYPAQTSSKTCYYDIRLERPSFQVMTPLTATTGTSYMADDQWVNVEEEHVIGYSYQDDYSSFLYLLEHALNASGGNYSCGTIFVSRIQHQSKKDFAPFFSALTLFIPNILGLPIRTGKVQNSYLFEVFNSQDELIYRGIHSGGGRAVCGFYYGYRNPDEKADYDATYLAIADFMADFQKIAERK